ncbi:hypothetical protein BCR36DRAFT_368370 [Piromyces finnis]|uniref:Uncharacterized protein n=1 Tax=Piromyces finnis TaxID=1754191 RepID=A0A1Y1VF53_9FUNG|nr:hypothetical protein BCR36DRAFT_368370 [Piromyces finnis]|eukprot:ORX54735.1 hypothetical protein BCR36DRAFT_368370 [Piromyces finnis]
MDKNSITHLYEFCQRKNSKVTLSDLTFEYLTENQLYNCKIKISNKCINKEYYDLSFFSKSKKEAKNKIAEVVYKDLITNGELKYIPFSIFVLFNLLDINSNDGTYNCIVKIEKRSKEYNFHLHCKSKKAAKNEISEHVYKALTEKTDNDLFNESIRNILSKNSINIDDLEIEIMEDKDEEEEEDNPIKLICLIKFKKFPNKYFLNMEPLTKNEINENFMEYLRKNDEFICNIENNKKKEKSEYKIEDYEKIHGIKCEFKDNDNIEVGKKSVKCRYEILGILLGEGKKKIHQNSDIQFLKVDAEKSAKAKALEKLKQLENSSLDEEKAFILYKNEINLKINKEIYYIAINEQETQYNSYIQNITQNFTSTSSKKEEKKYLNDINNIITEEMNKIKKEKKFNGSYLIKKINNYEVWNLINYEIILFIEFQIQYISYCKERIYNAICYKYKKVLDECMEDENFEKENKIRFRLKNGCTFSIYIGSSLYDKLLTKHIISFKGCLDIERKYIQFVILWSNLVLYQKFDDKKYRDYFNFLKEQERIFTTLALFSWDYTIKVMKEIDNKNKKNIYIYSFITLINVILNYISAEICWYEIENIKPPYLIDPISNRNLITSKNQFIWKAYKKYCEKIYNKDTKRVILFSDDNKENEYKIYFQPYIQDKESFNIEQVFFKVNYKENIITVKSSLYHIPKYSRNKEKLNVIFNSLQSYLLLNIYNSDNSIEIQNLNNAKDVLKFDDLNKRLTKELKYRIKAFFTNFIKEDKIKEKDPDELMEFRDYEKNILYFILGNNTNVSITIIVKFK